MYTRNFTDLDHASPVSVSMQGMCRKETRSIASERNLWNDGIVLSSLSLLRFFTAGGILYPPPETYVYYQNKAPRLLNDANASGLVLVSWKMLETYDGIVVLIAAKSISGISVGRNSEFESKSHGSELPKCSERELHTHHKRHVAIGQGGSVTVSPGGLGQFVQ